MMTSGENAARVAAIIREGRARIEDGRVEQSEQILAAVRRGEAITIFGVRYVPEEER